jgi:sigma-B regulation protein RsbU (phosphoserine phosphatase)
VQDLSVHPPQNGKAAQALRKVLVVDDSRAQRMVIARMLTSQGYEVQEAASAKEALALCATSAPDLVISDWMMPGMTGLEFCQHFRRMQRDSYGYFILLTSKADKEDVTRGFDAGADDFLTKPVNAPELRARIRAAERVLLMEQEVHEKNALISSTLGELQLVYDRLKSDLQEARKLQQSLIRDRFKRFGAADVALLMQSCGEVGGDLVGMFPAGPQHVGVFGLDVSGHGVSSALMTARLAGYLSASAPDQNVALRQAAGGAWAPRKTSETVKLLNDLILGEFETEHYFTLLLAILDTHSGEVEFTQAGHPSPLIHRNSGHIEPIGAGGLPVGLIEGAEFPGETVQLCAGDRLLIYSDGMTECANRAGQFLGEEGLASGLKALQGLPGPQSLDALMHTLAAFNGGPGFEDDVSAVLLDFKGPSTNA